MPRHEGTADIQVLAELIEELQHKYSRLFEYGAEPVEAYDFLERVAPMQLRDLYAHPLGDKRPSIDRMLREAVRCENQLIAAENSSLPY